MTGLEKIIERVEKKLRVIDISNKNTMGEGDQKRYQYELRGIKQALECLGYNLIIDCNPYYYKDGIASTYKLEAMEEE